MHRQHVLHMCVSHSAKLLPSLPPCSCSLVYAQTCQAVLVLVRPESGNAVRELCIVAGW